MNDALDHISKPCAAFAAGRLLAAGPLIEVALAIKNAPPEAAVLAFDDATGEVVDLDLRGTKQEIIARLAERPKAPPAASETPKAAPRGPGRPRLGVVAREVTLLPRHWEWLAAQPGGASVTLRKLVEAARREGGDDGRRRAAREAAYRFMTAMAGDLPGFEEAIRALFADDSARFEAQMAAWPKDVRDYALRLAAVAPAPERA